MGRLILIASAAVLAGLGLALNFAPGEVARLAGIGGDATLPLQLVAGGLLGVGVMNWLSRDRPFGGIYNRPLGLANVLLFVVGAFALGRAALADGAPGLWTLFVIYAAFACAFAWIVFIGRPVTDCGVKQ